MKGHLVCKKKKGRDKGEGGWNKHEAGGANSWYV